VFFKLKPRILFIIAVLLCAFQSQAARMSQYDAAFNLDWKFATGTQSGMEAPAFNDASWQTVSVPHSASYNAPTHSAEQGYYTGDYCYRKSFICPADARKVFIHFGAIMQTVTVYVNGSSVGSHDNSGYTGFWFDISNYVVKGASTCVALRCNVVQTSTSIPPAGNCGGGQCPDFELWSGMYRDVDLLFKNWIYVPLWGQRITTPGANSVHAITAVRNDYTSAQSVMVALTLKNSGGSSVATLSSALSVAAGSTSNFDMTMPVTSPSLWSPSSPTLYSLQTVVSVGGVVVDSVVEPSVGFRTFSWSGTSFSLNGTRTELYGVCMAQFMGWILNAVPDSRFAAQVALIKAMGINSIRCSHYPRADAFYTACDKLGMLVLCEVPSWGVNGGFSGNTAFWANMYSCDTEMVMEAYNHPCIYGWVLFNEQNENLNTYFNNENTIIHALDPLSGSGRVTCVANYQGAATKWTGDIFADNYNYNVNGLNTEAYGNAMNDADPFGNWFRNYIRGGTMDASGTSGESAQEVSCMTTYYWTTGEAGGHFWCFMDYSSGRNTTGREGIVDRLWLPKQVYFRFRNVRLGTATDYWAAGTPTSLALTADLTTLRADGSDISLITATLRNGNACVHAACNITFTASPAGCVRLLYGGHSTSTTDSGNPVTVAIEGGRCGVLLRTSRTAGAITVTATSSCGLTQATIPLVSNAVSEPIANPLVWLWPPTSVLPGAPHQSNDVHRLKTVYTVKGVVISFPSGAEKTIRIINCRGKTMASYTLKNGIPALVNHSVTGSGIFYAAWDDNGRPMLSRLNIVR